MIKLNYRLTQQEALTYYEMVLEKSASTRLPRWTANVWGLAISVVLLIAFKVYRDWVYIIIGIFFSLIWALFVGPAIYRSVSATLAKNKMKSDKFERTDITVVEDQKSLTVNNQPKDVVDYLAYFNLFIIAFTDQTKLIVPSRAFSDEKQMEQFIKDIVMLADKKSTTETV